MTARMTATREALAVLHLGPRDKHYHVAALAEVEEWETRLAQAERDFEDMRRSRYADEERAEAAEAEADRLKAAILHVVNDSPGTPQSVKGYLRAALASTARI